MIKYHFHAAPRDVRPLRTHRGDRLCHVYSDSSLAELVADIRAWRTRERDRARAGGQSSGDSLG